MKQFSLLSEGRRTYAILCPRKYFEIDRQRKKKRREFSPLSSGKGSGDPTISKDLVEAGKNLDQGNTSAGEGKGKKREGFCHVSDSALRHDRLPGFKHAQRKWTREGGGGKKKGNSRQRGRRKKDGGSYLYSDRRNAGE